MCTRKSVQHAKTHEIYCDDFSCFWHLYVLNNRVASENKDNLTRFVRNGLPKMLIKNPRVFFDVCKSIGEPMMRIPYEGTMSLFVN